MDTSKIKITHPLRFFSFFGLFIVFMFLAVKSCSDRSSTEGVKYVEADKVSDTKVADKSNTEELNEFIEDIKDGIKDKKEDIPEAVIAKLEDKNINAKKEEQIKKAVAEKKKAVAKAKEKPKAAPVKKSSFSSKTVIVKEQGKKISPFSKLEIKKTIGALRREKVGKVMVYGYYGFKEPKTKGFVRAAQLKNELIKQGLSSKLSIYALPEKTLKSGLYGKVVFKK